MTDIVNPTPTTEYEVWLRRNELYRVRIASVEGKKIEVTYVKSVCSLGTTDGSTYTIKPIQ